MHLSNRGDNVGAFDVCFYQYEILTPHFWLINLFFPLGVVWSIKSHIVEFQYELQWLASLLISFGCIVRVMYTYFRPPSLNILTVNSAHLTELSRVCPLCIFVNCSSQLSTSSKAKGDWFIVYPWQCSPINYRRICREIVRIQL